MTEPKPSLEEDLKELSLLERELENFELENSLRLFIPKAWAIIEPSIFVPNWHIDAICEHLEAVTVGDILYLLITMPPRHSKSLVVSVLWPVWEWLKYPQYRWVFASYAFSLSVRDSIKRRTVIQSRWYQERWADKYALLKEQNSKVRFENSQRGFMLASSVGGSNTGEGGERIIADDPHNVKKIESEDIRNDAVNWWNIVMSTRRNDVNSARVCIQQRVHEGDVAGNIIEHGDAVHLNLPAEYDPRRRCFTNWVHKVGGAPVHWEDPRHEPGELLNPLRFGQDQIEKAKIDLGDYQFAAQFQQDPTPPEGSIIQAEWLQYYGGPTGIGIPEWDKCTNAFTPLLSIDCTFREHKDTDYVAGLVWAMYGPNIYLLPLCIHDRLSFTGTLEAVTDFCGGKTMDGQEKRGIYPFIKYKLVENKANGPAVIDTLRHKVSGMMPFEPGNASKESRLQAVSWRFRARNIFLPHEKIAPWIKEYVYELCAFPKAKRDDYVDATSQALLFIGGDPQVEGAPILTEQASKWHNMTDASESSHSSPWGNMMVPKAKSVWRY